VDHCNTRNTDQNVRRKHYPLPISYNLTSVCKALSTNRIKTEIPEYCWPEAKKMGQYFPCSDNTFVGSLQNMSIDYGTVHPDVLGTLFDPERRLSINTYDIEDWDHRCQAANQYREHDQIATALTVYGYAFAHCTVELLPRLIYLIDQTRHIDGLKILIETGHIKQFIDLMVSGGFTSYDRFIWYSRSSKILHHANKVYFVGESPACGYRHGDVTGFSWQSAELMSLMRTKMIENTASSISGDRDMRLDALLHHSRPVVKNVMQLVANIIRSGKHDQGLILVLNRVRTSLRNVQNIETLVDALKLSFPDEMIEYFDMQSDLELSGIIHLYSKYVKCIISPHGATLSHMNWLPQNTGVLELAYNGHASMRFPGNYFYTVAVSLDLVYGAVDCDGENDTPMIAPIKLVEQTLRKMLQVINPIWRRPLTTLDINLGW